MIDCMNAFNLCEIERKSDHRTSFLSFPPPFIRIHYLVAMIFRHSIDLNCDKVKENKASKRTDPSMQSKGVHP